MELSAIRRVCFEGLRHALLLCLQFSVSIFHFPNTPFRCFSVLACFFLLFQTRGFSNLPFPRAFRPSRRHADLCFFHFRVSTTNPSTRRFCNSAFLRVYISLPRHEDYTILLFFVSLIYISDTKIPAFSNSSCLSLKKITRKSLTSSNLRVW